MDSIRAVSYADILGAPNARELFDEYGAECSIPEIGQISPQAEMYASMEKSGMLKCFGAFHVKQLVGFATLVTFIVPHYGKRSATVESLFVDRAHRKSLLGLALLVKLERQAKEMGCAAIQYSAPAGSILERLLSNRKSFRKTNSIFTKSLA